MNTDRHPHYSVGFLSVRGWIRSSKNDHLLINISDSIPIYWTLISFLVSRCKRIREALLIGYYKNVPSMLVMQSQVPEKWLAQLKIIYLDCFFMHIRLIKEVDLFSSIFGLCLIYFNKFLDQVWLLMQKKALLEYFLF